MQRPVDSRVRNAWKVCLAVFLLACLWGCSDSFPPDVLERSRTTPQWFDDAKLGIFIHWGPASVPAFAAGAPLEQGDLENLLSADSPKRDLPYAEWYLNAMSYPGSATAKHHAKHYGNAPYTDFQNTFEKNVDAGWDPEAWAELFKRAGARYVVLVSKHHDGYTLWPSAVPHPTRKNWGSQRDMVGELAGAVRAKGMRFGTYYSTGLDWSWKLVTDEDWVRGVMLSAPEGQDYADYVYAHMIELVARYKPDILWADIGYPSKGRLADLFSYYFAQVPEGVVNDRWAETDILARIAAYPGMTGLLKTLARWSIEYLSDPLKDDEQRRGYKTAEYDSLPGIAPFKWEATRGLGSSFAHNAAETQEDMLSSVELVDFLVDTVAKNGNVLINVGPDSFGRIPAIQQAPLLSMGEWVAHNGEAIFSTRPWVRYGNERGRNLRYTMNDDTLFAIVQGAVEAQFSIEEPGVSYKSLSVLGAQVRDTRVEDGMITITLDSAIDSAATVVRYQLR